MDHAIEGMSEQGTGESRTVTARTSRRTLLRLLSGGAMATAGGVGLQEVGEAKKKKVGNKAAGCKKRGSKACGCNKGGNKGGKHSCYRPDNGGGGADIPPTFATYAPEGEELAFLALLNAYRSQGGLGPLALQQQLGAAAEHHSQDMANLNYFDHTLANGVSFQQNIEDFGYIGWTSLGENIAAGQETAEEVMEAWRNSPPHDQNMRNPHFTHIGIGLAYNSNATYGWYWTTTFGSQ